MKIVVNKKPYSEHASIELAQSALNKLFQEVITAGYKPKITNSYLDGTMEGFKYRAGKYLNQISIVL